MPFLRILRDKRGYETTYLMHLFRDGHRQRSRVLYVFRTPAGVRVGRTPLEPDVLRQLEERHPEIAFEWEAILEQQQVIEPAPEMRRRKPPRREDRSADAVEPEAAPEPAEIQPAAAGGGAGSAATHPVIPAELEGTTPGEQIAFLERVYPLARERAQRMADPVRRDALTALTERLNPAAWTDADRITTGLQQAAEALDRLSRVLARRRRRGRKRLVPPDGRHGEITAGSAAPVAGEPAIDDTRPEPLAAPVPEGNDATTHAATGGARLETREEHEEHEEHKRY